MATYPTTTVITAYLTDQGITDIAENDTDFLLDWQQLLWHVLKRTHAGGVLGVYIDPDDATLFNVVGGLYDWNGTETTYTAGASIDPTDNDTTYVWLDSANTVQTAVDGTGWPSGDHLKLAEVVVDTSGNITNITDRRKSIAYGSGEQTSYDNIVTYDGAVVCHDGNVVANN